MIFSGWPEPCWCHFQCLALKYLDHSYRVLYWTLLLMNLLLASLLSSQFAERNQVDLSLSPHCEPVLRYLNVQIIRISQFEIRCANGPWCVNTYYILCLFVIFDKSRLVLHYLRPLFSWNTVHGPRLAKIASMPSSNRRKVNWEFRGTPQEYRGIPFMGESLSPKKGLNGLWRQSCVGL